MGLFLGASFITLVELYFTAFRVLRALLTRAFKTIYHKVKFYTNAQDKHPA